MKPQFIHAVCLYYLNSPNAIDHFCKDNEHNPSKQELINSRVFLEKHGLIINLDTSYTTTNKGNKLLKSAQSNNSTDELDINQLSTSIEYLTH